MVARQGRIPKSSPTSRPRTPTSTRRPPTSSRCGRRSSTRSRRAPRKPTCRCRPGDGDWWYYARTFEGKQYGVQCRCPVSDPDDWTPPELDENTEIPGEQVLLDANVEAEGHDFFALGAGRRQPGRQPAGVLRRRRRRRAIHAAVQGFTHRRAVPGRDRRHRRRRDLGRRQPHRVLRDRGRRPSPRHGVAATGSAPASRRSRCITKPTNGSGSAWGSPEARPTS